MNYKSKLLVNLYGETRDVSDFINKHPGGPHLLRLIINQDNDCTDLFEAHHLNHKFVLQEWRKLPLVKISHNIKSAPNAVINTPWKSPLYMSILQAVKPILKNSSRNDPYFGEWCVLFAWISAIYFYYNSLFNPFLIGIYLGATMAWVGLAVQHTANHGGLHYQAPFVNYIFGHFNDICCGGSSIVWRYHHQVSHHRYPNHEGLDEDVFSSFPFIRFDYKQQRQWFHAWQYLYVPFFLPFLYFSIQLDDIKCLLNRKRLCVVFNGETNTEYLLAWITKFMHCLILWGPYILNIKSFMDTFMMSMIAILIGSLILSASFIISHNVNSCKTKKAITDWAENQIINSVNWGNQFHGFFMGGLNYQIEHHIFPMLQHSLYPKIAPTVKSICEKNNVKYVHYKTFWQNLYDCWQLLYDLGHYDDQPKAKHL